MKKFAALLLTFPFLASLSMAAEKAAYEAQLGIINVGGFVIFYNSRGALSYATLTGKERSKEAIDVGELKCRSCQHGFSIPTGVTFTSGRSTNISSAQGDGSFKKALENLYRSHPELRGIYDVKVDLQRVNILGIYRRVCTEVVARGFK